MTVRPPTADVLLVGWLFVLAAAVGGLGGSAAATDATTPSTSTTPTTGSSATPATTTTTASTATTTAAATTPAAGTTPPSDLETVVVARYRAGNGSMMERTILDAATVARAAPPSYDSRAETWAVPVTLTEDGATAFADALVEAGFTTDGVADCPTTDSRNDRGHCLLLVADGEVTSAFGVGERFAAVVESGEFAADRRFVLAVANESDAKRVWRGLLDDGRGLTPDTTTTGERTSEASTTGDESGGDASSVASTTRTASLQTTTGGDGDEQNPTPGFGVGAALAALAVAALALWRR
jgi:PGF-CTERM protein